MGAIASAVFGARNWDKSANSDTARVLAATGQTVNAARGLASATALFEGAPKMLEYAAGKAQTLVDTLEKTAQQEGKLGVAAKGAQFLSKNVNPMLCLASAYRVVKDEDWQNAAVEEGLAMSTMFGAERMMKIARAPFVGDEQIIQSLKEGALKEKLLDLGKIFKTCPDKRIRLGATILAELAFVMGSIAAFGIGKNFGQILSGRGNG